MSFGGLIYTAGSLRIDGGFIGDGGDTELIEINGAAGSFTVGAALPATHVIDATPTRMKLMPNAGGDVELFGDASEPGVPAAHQRL